jgi:hypothetical protein
MRTPSEATRRKGFESSGSVSDQSNQASMRANLAWPEQSAGNPSRSATYSSIHDPQSTISHFPPSRPFVFIRGSTSSEKIRRCGPHRPTGQNNKIQTMTQYLPLYPTTLTNNL